MIHFFFLILNFTFLLSLPFIIILFSLLATLKNDLDLNRSLQMSQRVLGTLTAMSNEIDSPLYYNIPELASTVQQPTPLTADIFSALFNAGYKCSQFHHEPDCVKTNAPDSVVWDIMRKLCEESPVAGTRKKMLSATAQAILDKPSCTDVSFEYSDQNVIKVKGLNRFSPNPEAHWGPKSKGILTDRSSPKG